MSQRPEHDAGFAGPGYSGFGGSAGYSGSGVGGVTGGYAGADIATHDPWRPAPVTHHDDRICEEVRSRLDHGHGLEACRVSVSVEAGVVTLQGDVPNRRLKRTIVKLAEGVPGTERVHARLHCAQSWLDELKERIGLAPPR